MDGLDLTALYAAAYNAYLRDASNDYARTVLNEIECVSVPQIWAIGDRRVGASWREIQRGTRPLQASDRRQQRDDARKGE